MLAPPESEEMWRALTDLLHRAYRKQVDLGLRPLAGRQTVEVTERRCSSGETFIAEEVGGPDHRAAAEAPDVESVPRPLLGPPLRLWGMIVLQEIEDAAFPAWFLRPEVAHFSLLAVEPDLQGRGVGGALIAAAEARAAQRGYRELALSMAEPDRALLEYYRRRGFRHVQHWRWPYTNYRSAILSRPIEAGALVQVRESPRS